MDSHSNLVTRTLTAFFIVPTVIFFIFIESPLIIITLYVFAVVVMAKELYTMTLPHLVSKSTAQKESAEQNLEVQEKGDWRLDSQSHKIGFLFIIVGALLTSASVTGQIDFVDEDKLVLGFMLLLFLALSFLSIFYAKEFSTSFRNQQIHLFLFFYLNFVFLHVLKLKYFFIGTDLQGLAGFYLLLSFGICWFFDSAAYLFGRKWGKKKIGISVSPQKSWAGLVAGLISTLAAGGLVSQLLLWMEPQLWEKSFFALAFWPWLLYPVLGLVAQGGDLIASLHKRSSGVKDTGYFLKGHGGFYDRNDSVILVAVTLFYFLKFYHDYFYPVSF